MHRENDTLRNWAALFQCYFYGAFYCYKKNPNPSHALKYLLLFCAYSSAFKEAFPTLLEL